MFGLFKKQRSESKRAIIFVDYEHWYISFDKFYNKKPDIKAFREELAQTYEIADIIFFADFSNPSLRSEISNESEKSPVLLLKPKTLQLILKKILPTLSCWTTFISQP